MFLSLSFATSESELQDALGSSNWGQRFANPTEPNQSSSSSAEVNVDTSSTAAESCERSDQTSVPYKSFLQLLQNKELSVSHNPTTGQLNLNGGMMISNCNSMLRYNFSQAQSGRPYLFQVEIGRPSGCSEETCSYTVDVAEDSDNPGIKTGEKVIEVEPNYFGYMKCLEETGVFQNGNIVADKIVATEFSHSETGLYSTGELAFYSRGPLSQQRGARYGEVEASGGSCDYFEQIQENGFTVYSEDDIDKFQKEELFDRICSGGDYRLIERNLANFVEFRSMYQILKQVRDLYLLEEVKKLHTELRRESYEDLDAEKYQSVITDFYNKVIKPIQAKIARLYNDLGSTSNSSRQASLRAEIDELTAKLVEYNKAPYLNQSDYENMKSFIRRAPLDQEPWREAALALYSSSNTAYHYSRYQSGSRLDDLSIRSSNSLIESDIRTEQDMLERLGNLASDPNLSYAREYQEVAQSIQQSQQYQIQAMRQFQMQEQRYMQEHCLNPRKYWINRQRCVSEVQQSMQDAEYMTYMYTQEVNQDVAHYNGLSQQWAQIEAARNGTSRTQPTNVNQPRQFNPQNYNPSAPGSPDFYQQMAMRNQGRQPGQAGDFWSRVGGQQNQNGFPNQNQSNLSQQQIWMMQQQQNQRYPYQNNGASANWNFNWNAGAGQQYPPQQGGWQNQQRGTGLIFADQQRPGQGGDFWSRVGGSPTSQFRAPMSIDPRYQGQYQGNANYNYHLNQPTYNNWNMGNTGNGWNGGNQGYYGPAPAGGQVPWR
jgi:hypothetical protein